MLKESSGMFCQKSLKFFILTDQFFSIVSVDIYHTSYNLTILKQIWVFNIVIILIKFIWSL